MNATFIEAVNRFQAAKSVGRVPRYEVAQWLRTLRDEKNEPYSEEVVMDCVKQVAVHVESLKHRQVQPAPVQPQPQSVVDLGASAQNAEAEADTPAEQQPQGEPVVNDPMPSFPAIAKKFPNWVTYVGPKDKAPKISGTFNNASSNDPSTWVDYKTACDHIAKGLGCQFLGFVTNGAQSEYLTGIDIDGGKTNDGVQPWVERVLELVAQIAGPTYIEWTPNGGLRAWVRGDFKKHGRRTKYKMDAAKGWNGKAQVVEVFDDGLYFTTSGNRMSNTSEVAVLDDTGTLALLDGLAKLSIEDPMSKAKTNKGGEADPAFAEFFSQVGWQPLEDRMSKMDDPRYRELKLEDGKLTYCPMPGHGPRDLNVPYSRCFGIVPETNGAMVHCFGCGWSGDMVKTMREFDGSMLTMTDYARALATEYELDAAKLFPDKKLKLNQRPDMSSATLADANGIGDQAKQKAEEMKAAIRASVDRAVFNPDKKDKKVTTFDYQGLIVHGHLIGWIAPTKAEKSLWALRKAMHDACGRDWMNCRNMRGAQKVFYLDTENSEADFNDRYAEIVAEFSPREQELIRVNLRPSVVLGKVLTEEEGIEIEYHNTEFWEHIRSRFQSAEVVYLDCWYDLHSAKAADNETQKRALMIIRSYFPGRTLHLIQHTGRETSESLLKKTPAGLRELGAFRWKDRVAQGFVFLKKVETIICQEKRLTEDGEFIDFEIWSRSIPHMPLLTFEPVYFEGEKELKYRRKLVENLSTLAASVLTRLQKQDSWKSWYEISKEIGRGGKQKWAVDELKFKGLLYEDEHGWHVNKSLGVEALKQTANQPDAHNAAIAFLEKTVLRVAEGLPESVVRSMAESEGIVLGQATDYKEIRAHLDLKTKELIWRMGRASEDTYDKQRIEEAITKNTMISRDDLTTSIGCGGTRMSRLLKDLGYGTKKKGQPWVKDATKQAA